VTNIRIFTSENHPVNIYETGTNPEVITGEYFYDGDGNRIKTIVDGKTTYYIGNYYEKIVESTSTTIKKYYYSGGVRFAMSDNGDVRYFITDHLGSTTKMINANGNKYPDDNNFEIKYASWGSDQPGTPNLGTTFKYTGQRQAEAGLYYYNARWYDPKLGRFIQADTIIPDPGNPLAWDRYAYGFNNPVNSIDPSGHTSCFGDDQDCKDVNGTVFVNRDSMKKIFGWDVSKDFSISQIMKIYAAARDLEKYVDRLTNGHGLDWIRKYTAGTNIHHGGIPHDIATQVNHKQDTSIVLPYTDIWLDSTFQTDVNPKQYFLHELSHVIDNNLPKSGILPSTISGGGAADQLTLFLGGSPDGPRYDNGLSGIDSAYWWVGSGRSGNISTADYFAESLAWSVCNSSFVPSPLITSWIDSIIYLSR
jgi:RHS repeat-associated protein